MIRRLALLAALALAPAPSTAQTHFGYVGILCGLEAKGEDFAAEVAPFTNIAHVCPSGDIATDAARLARAWELGMTPLYHVEPFFFRRTETSLRRLRSYDLWQQALLAIAQSGVPTEALILYVADEPSLVRADTWNIYNVTQRIQADLPGARTMVIDAYRERFRPQIAWGVDYWGFNRYLVRDPANDPVFMDYLRSVINNTPNYIELVLVMDSTHTEYHAEAGITSEDMAEVARNYAALAAATDRVGILMAYAWPSDIDGTRERGARDLPAAVRAAHEEIGRAITGR
ncbi:hypothetical protein [Gymnodinialimonas sp.]